MYIADNSPALAGQALTLALSAIQSSTLDTTLYEQAFQKYRQHITAIQAGDIQNPVAVAWYESVKGHEVPIDRVWLEQTRKEVQSTQDRLEVELKGYSTNLIKESIRVSLLSRWWFKCGRVDQDARQ